MSLPPTPLSSQPTALSPLQSPAGHAPAAGGPSQRRLTWTLILDDLASAQARRAFAGGCREDQQPGRE